jgi:hypothetical protein
MLRSFFAALVLLASANCFAQSSEPSDAWLMKNYRFAPAPSPGEIQQVSPALGQLQSIQNTTLSILRKANFSGDYETALAAAAQAAFTAQLIGTLTGQMKPPDPRQSSAAGIAKRDSLVYLIAFKDNTIRAATAVWTDRLMAHYITREGAHEQVLLDLVDWRLSAELNWNHDACAP